MALSKETVNDIVGKGLAYEERVKKNVTTVRQVGTIPVGIGSAHWGPIGVPTKFTNFDSAFGTPVDRDYESKDYSGLVIKKALGIAAPFAYFTRVADSSAKEASITINKQPAYATFVGAIKIIGKDYAIESGKNTFGFKYKEGGIVKEASITVSPSVGISLIGGDNGAAEYTEVDVTTDNVDDYKNITTGQILKIEIDGLIKQYVVREGDLFNTLLDKTAGEVFKMNNGGVGVPVPAIVGVSLSAGVDYDSSVLTSVAEVAKIETAVTSTNVSTKFGATGFYGFDIMATAAITGATLLAGAIAFEVTGAVTLDNIVQLINDQFVDVFGSTPLVEAAIESNTLVIRLTQKGAHQLNIGAYVGSATLVDNGSINGDMGTVGNGFITSTTDTGVSEINRTATLRYVESGATTDITLSVDAINHNTYRKIIAKFNADIEAAVGSDVVCAPVIQGSLLVGFTFTTVNKGNAYSLTLSKASPDRLFDNGGILNTTAPFGTLQSGDDDNGNINDYVMRLAVATNKLLLQDYTGASVTVNDSNKYIHYVKKLNGKATFNLYSQNIGANSVIKISNFPIAFPTASIETVIASGSNKSIATIVKELNTALVSYGFSASINSTGMIVIQALSSGDEYIFEVISDTDSGSNKSSVTLLKYLGIKDLDNVIDKTGIANRVTGSDAVLNICSFTAYYTGRGGNDISITKETSRDSYNVTISMNGTVLEKFYNYSYKVADINFIGNLIANSSKTQKIVIMSVPEGIETITVFDDGTYSLSGGISGTVVPDDQYLAALDIYKNMDIYNFDVICVNNISTSDVIEKIDEVCKYRKDCFGIIDPPEIVAGLIDGKAMGGIDDMIQWHNGNKVIDNNEFSKKLNSKYLVTYFPWVLIDTDSEKNPKQWHAPSVVAVAALAQVDKYNNHKFGPIAGKNTVTGLINDIAYYISNEDKGRMYDDNIGNNINPIVYTSKEGFFIDGQKTSQREINKYTRIHVMRIGLFIKKTIYNISPDFFWKPVTSNTRADFKSTIEKDVMKVLYDAGAIKKDYKIYVEELNNTEIESQNGMVALMEWTPIGSVEKIKVISTMIDDVVVTEFI